MKLKKKPKYGDIRIVKKFAFSPKELKDTGDRIIFESYYVKQEFMKRAVCTKFPFTLSYDTWYKVNFWKDIEYFKNNN